MRASTKKLTTAAVCTAVAVIMCVFTAYLPFSFMPLYIAAFSIFLACKRGSLTYGMLCALATVGIMFLMTGLSVSWFMLLFMFAPYGVLAYFMHRFTYFKPKTGIIRGVIAAAFFNMTFGFVYLVATRVVTVGIDIPITEWVNALGGYWVLALIATAVLVPLDFIFNAMSLVVLKRIPAPVTERKIAKNDSAAEDSDPLGISDKEDGEPQKQYDIFGYEINGESGGVEPKDVGEGKVSENSDGATAENTPEDGKSDENKG